MENTKQPQMAEKRIKVSKDGPYLVSGGTPILRETIVTDKEGTAIAWHFDAKLPHMEKSGL